MAFSFIESHMMRSALVSGRKKPDFRYRPDLESQECFLFPPSARSIEAEGLFFPHFTYSPLACSAAMDCSKSISLTGKCH